jgi:hypothetical protein
MIKKFLLSTVAFGFLTLLSPTSIQAEQAIIAVQPPTTSPVNVPSDANAQPYINTGTGIVFLNAPTISAATYTSGNCVGGSQSITTASRFGSAGGVGTAPKSGWLTSIEVIDKASQTVPLDIILYDNTPATYTDNTPCAVQTGDANRVIGVFHLTDWTLVGYSLGTILTNFHYTSAAPSGQIYAVIIARGTPTYTANSLSFRYSLIQD